MGKKKSTTASTQTSTPNVPSWLQDTTQGLNTKIQQIGSTDPYSFVAKSNPLQTQAQTAASNAVANPSGLFGEAAQAYRDAPQVQSASLLDNLDAYQNPYRQQVLNSTLSDYDANAAQTRAAQLAAAGGTHAFNGSRYGVREALTEGQLARGRATTESGLLSDMFNTSANLSNQDAARRQDASSANSQLALAQAGGLAGVAGAQGADSRANLGLLQSAGNDQYAIDQATAQAPITAAQAQSGLFAGMNPAAFIGQTTTGNSTTTSQGSLLDQLGQAAKIAGTVAMFSDERLKTDIQRVGSDNRGRDVYDYEYLWEPGVKRRGYMAQDLLKTDPHAVKRDPRGFLMVDYGAVS